MRYRALTGWILASLLLGCATDSLPEPAQPLAREKSLLVPSGEIEGNFMVRQHISVVSAERSADFEAILQKHCNEFVVLGLSPVGLRLFSLHQSGREIDVETMAAANWPFDPERILLDVHRTYFYPLANPPLKDGIHELGFQQERLQERWHEGRLVERRIAIKRDGHDGWLEIQYRDMAGEAISDLRWQSRSVRLIYPLHEYELQIETISYHAIQCRQQD